MKKTVIALLVMASGIGIVSFKRTLSFQPIAVVELFTSQGCSSCPPADELLSKTIENAKRTGRQIFALSFHVDYWNRLGWTDPFSDPAFSARQRAYAPTLGLEGIYTPQMIVNGRKEFVGSDEKKLTTALEQSLKSSPTAGFKAITAESTAEGSINLHFELAGSYAGCKVNAALVSLKEMTHIKRGENNGLQMTGENIVRQFISIPATASGELKFKTSPSPSGNNKAIIAYIQNNADLTIIGAAMAEIK